MTHAPTPICIPNLMYSVALVQRHSEEIFCKGAGRGGPKRAGAVGKSRRNDRREINPKDKLTIQTVVQSKKAEGRRKCL